MVEASHRLFALGGNSPEREAEGQHGECNNNAHINHNYGHCQDRSLNDNSLLFDLRE